MKNEGKLYVLDCEPRVVCQMRERLDQVTEKAAKKVIVIFMSFSTLEGCNWKRREVWVMTGISWFYNLYNLRGQQQQQQRWGENKNK